MNYYYKSVLPEQMGTVKKAETMGFRSLACGAFHLSTSGVFHPDSSALSFIGSFPAVLLYSSIILFQVDASASQLGSVMAYLVRLLLFFFQFEILNNLKTLWSGATLDARAKDNAVMNLFPIRRTHNAMWGACLLSVCTMVVASILSGGSLFHGSLLALITVHHYMEFDNAELNKTFRMAGKSHWLIKNLVAAFVGYWLLPCWLAGIAPYASTLGKSLLQRSAFAVFYWQNQDVKDMKVDREEGCTTLPTLLDDRLGYHKSLLVNAGLTLTSGLCLLAFLANKASSPSIYFVALITLCGVCFAACAGCQVYMIRCTKDINEKKAQKLAKMSYGFMVLCELFTLLLV